MSLSLNEKLELATPGSLWVNKNKRIDTILLVGNMDVAEDKRDKFPLQVTYVNDRQSTYTVPLAGFLKARENKGIDALLESRLAGLFAEPEQPEVQASAPAPAAVRGGRVQTQDEFLSAVLGDDQHSFGDEDETAMDAPIDMGDDQGSANEGEQAPLVSSAVRMEAQLHLDEYDEREMPLMDSEDYAAMLVSVAQEPIIVASAEGDGLETNVTGINLAFRLPRDAADAEATVMLIDAAFNPASTRRTFSSATVRGRDIQWNMFIGVTRTSDLFGDYAVVRLGYMKQDEVEVPEAKEQAPVEQARPSVRELAAQLQAQAQQPAAAVPAAPIEIPADPTPLEILGDNSAVTSMQALGNGPVDPQ